MEFEDPTVPVSIPRVHLAFGLALFLVAVLAWATAAATTGPWFSPTVSGQVYALSLLASILVALVLAALAGLRVFRIDDAVRALELRIAGLPEAASLPSAEHVTQEDLQNIAPSDEEVDELLAVLHTSTGAPIAELEVTGTLLDVETAITGTKIRKEVLKAAVRQSAELLGDRVRGVRSVAGPIVASFLLTAVAGAMLPGSEGFALRNFQLNTALVLFLGYAWAFLAAWAVAAVAMLARRVSPAKST